MKRCLVVILVSFLLASCGGTPTPVFPTPSPAFSAGMDVRLDAPYGDVVIVYPTREEDCGFLFSNSSEVPRGERATILGGVCFREEHGYYYEVEAQGLVIWVREQSIVPVDMYTPVPTSTAIPTIAPARRSPIDSCVNSGEGVRYVISGRGVSRVALTWQNDTGGTSQGEYTVPFCKTFRGFKGGDFLYISAQIVQGEGDIQCRIYDHSSVVAQASASGFASIATCSASAR